MTPLPTGSEWTIEAIEQKWLRKFEQRDKWKLRA